MDDMGQPGWQNHGGRSLTVELLLCMCYVLCTIFIGRPWKSSMVPIYLDLVLVELHSIVSEKRRGYERLKSRSSVLQMGNAEHMGKRQWLS